MVVVLETANKQVASLEKYIDTLEEEKREQKVGKYRTL